MPITNNKYRMSAYNICIFLQEKKYIYNQIHVFISKLMFNVVEFDIMHAFFYPLFWIVAR